jgi:RNA polymerase sigma-70 factor (ECF subfamily)
MQLHNIITATAREFVRRCGLPDSWHAGTDAAQIWQVAFLQNLSHRANPSRVKFPFAYKVLQRICFKLVKDSRRRWTGSLELDIGDANPGPIEAASQAEDRSAVYLTLLRLPSAARNALLLHYWHGVTTNDSALLWGISPATVRVRTHRARLQFAELFMRAP